MGEVSGKGGEYVGGEEGGGGVGCGGFLRGVESWWREVCGGVVGIVGKGMGGLGVLREYMNVLRESIDV